MSVWEIFRWIGVYLLAQRVRIHRWEELLACWNSVHLCTTMLYKLASQLVSTSSWEVNVFFNFSSFVSMLTALLFVKINPARQRDSIPTLSAPLSLFHEYTGSTHGQQATSICRIKTLLQPARIAFFCSRALKLLIFSYLWRKQDEKCLPLFYKMNFHLNFSC